MDVLLNKNTVKQFEEFYKTGDHMYPNEHIVRIVRGYFGKDGNARKVLDYGFGPGENLLYLLRLGYTCSGLEVANNAKLLVEHKLENYPQFSGQVDLKVINGEDKTIPWPDNTFDFILSNQVLYHLVSEGKIINALNEFKRVLKPGGRMIVSMLGEHCQFKVGGKETEKDVYRYIYPDNKMNNYIKMNKDIERFYFVLRNEAHAREVFSMFNIDEVGWWRENYLGTINHHYVILGHKS